MKKPRLIWIAATAALFLPSCETTGSMDKGVWLRRLPAGAERTEYNGITYYQADGNFFVKRRGRFVSVASPTSTLREKHDIARGVDYASTPAGGIR